jgi:tetratricopeptide (TPR) repeat protein
VAAGGLLVLLTLAAYLPVCRAGYIWDDNDYVTANMVLRSRDGLRAIWCDLRATPQYYPLVHTAYWIEYRLWGLDPTGYHVVNVLLHATSVLFLWRVLRRLGVPGAWLAAAVFAVHPVHVESVAWITERKNVLSGCFYLASAAAYLRFAPPGPEESRRPGRWAWYGVALLLFLCALLSKTVAGSLPAALLLVTWWKRGRIRRADVLPLVPFFLLALSLGLLTAILERRHVGATGPEWDLSAVDRCLIAGRAAWFYAGKLAWPAPLLFVYPRWSIDAHQWWQYLSPFAAVALIITLWLARHRSGRGPLAAVLFFGGTLVPALGFFNLYPMRFSFVADHFQYLASIGLIVLAVSAGHRASSRSGAPVRSVARAAGTCVLIVLAALTWRQTQVYADLETLWRSTIARNPSAWMAHCNLATVLIEQGRFDEAAAHCRQALRLKPDYPEAHSNLGTALTGLRQFDEAIVHYTEALRLRPVYPEALHNMGMALANQGRVDEAVALYTRALKLKPAYPQAWNNLGLAMAGKNQMDEAIRHFAEAVRLDPAYPEAHNNLGIALAGQGKTEDAIRHYQEALRLNPAYAGAHNNLGVALVGRSRIDEAIHHYSEALRLRPDFADAHSNLGIALARKADFPASIRSFSNAIRLNPSLASAYARRAEAYLAVADYESAWADVRACRQLGWTCDPEFIARLQQATGRSE